MENVLFKQYRALEKGEFICVGVDTAAGGIDSCVGQFLSKNKLDVPIVFAANITANEMTPIIYEALNNIYKLTEVRPCVAYERNNGGVFEMERLARMNRQDKYTIFEMFEYGTNANRIPYKIGWETNSATRNKMLIDLKEAIDKKLIRIYDETTIQELFSFIVVQLKTRWKAAANVGYHDDHIMSLAIAWQLFLTQQPLETVNETDLPKVQLFDEDGFY